MLNDDVASSLDLYHGHSSQDINFQQNNHCQLEQWNTDKCNIENIWKINIVLKFLN